MKKVNYHTHTYRCGHANGNEEEMIQAAINMGIEDLGMCGHVPLPHYRKHLIFFYSICPWNKITSRPCQSIYKEWT